jgi:peptide/nickel transport system substrate-binding protein
VERSHRRPGARHAVVVLIALLAVGLSWGLGTALASSGSSSPASGKTTLRLGWTVDPDSLNPFVGFLSSSYEVWSLNYDVLVGMRSTDLSRPQGLNQATGLAYKWSHSPDGLVWTFKVRDDVKWQDGVPFTAADVAFTYNYVIKGNMGNFTSYTQFIDRVTAPDPTTVKMYCSRPKANMLSLWIPILPEHIWSKVPYKAAAATFQNPAPIVGTGPFQVVERKKDEYVRLVANKNYWRGAPKVDEVIFQNYQNTDTMAQDLKNGTLQAAVNIPQAQFDTLGQPPLTSIKGANLAFDELAFNCYTGPSLGNPVLTDPKFRQALNWAVDTDKISQLAYYGFSAPGTSVIAGGYYESPPDWHWQPPADLKYGFDLKKADQLLTAAGYKLVDGRRLDKQGKPISLRLWARTQQEQSQSSGRLIAGWFKQLGLGIQFSVVDENTITDHILNTVKGKLTPDYDMFLWGWVGENDPNFILSVFLTSQIGSWSDSGWSDPAYDKLYARQQTTLDVNERLKLVYQMQQMLYEQSPYIVLVYPKDIESYDTGSWTGWVRSPEGRGGVFYTNATDSYLYVHRVTAGTASSGGSRAAIVWGAIVVAVCVVVVVVVLMRRRSGGRQELET